MLDVEMLAQDVATSVTYFLKNVHERMVITNIAIKDPFVAASALKFEVVHGRASNLVGGIERYEDNIYADHSVREKELELAQKDPLFAEISGLP